jgi:perosamine synthetase
MIPYGRQTITQADVQAVVAALRSDWLTQGPRVDAFEEALCRTTGARYCVAVSSGTAALHLAMLALEIGPGDTVLTSPITFSASANCAAYVGARPGFVDIDAETYHMSPDRLEHHLRSRRDKVRAIVPVHFMGTVADMAAYSRIGARYGVPIVEDTAHALGASYDDRGTARRVGSCTHADISILSFHPIKHITTGEGGALLTNDRRLYERARRFRHHGMTRPASRPRWFYDIPELGFNYRITDIQCALGISQLSRLKRYRRIRHELVKAYNRRFRGNPNITLPHERPGTTPSYHLYVIQVPEAKRQGLYDHLRQKGIATQVNYIPVHLLSYYRNTFGYKAGDFPNAERYYRRCLSLPLFPGLSDRQQRRVIAEVNRFLR